MKHKKLKMSVAFLLLGLGGMLAQEALPATGGDAIGSGGTVSYTVGQAAYTANGTNGSVTLGVQQSYVVSTILGVELTNINLEVLAYPNPTTDYLILKIGDVVFASQSGLNYQLYDIQGRLLKHNKIVDNNTTIKMKGMQTATYILRIVNDHSTLKTFKIIKK